MKKLEIDFPIIENTSILIERVGILRNNSNFRSFHELVPSLNACILIKINPHKLISMKMDICHIVRGCSRALNRSK